MNSGDQWGKAVNFQKHIQLHSTDRLICLILKISILPYFIVPQINYRIRLGAASSCLQTGDMSLLDITRHALLIIQTSMVS